MTIGPAPDCERCKHLHIPTEPGVNTCDAFPDGIPDEIMWEGTPHIEPYPGDHGIQFDAVEGDGGDDQ